MAIAEAAPIRFSQSMRSGIGAAVISADGCNRPVANTPPDPVMVTTLTESAKSSSWQQSRNSAAVSSSTVHPPLGGGKRIAARNSMISQLILRYIILGLLYPRLKFG